VKDQQRLIRANVVLDHEVSARLNQQAHATKLSRSTITRAALRAIGELDLARLGPRNEDQLAAVLIATVRAGRQALRW
jgi:predicted transcriptional regulator